MKSEWEWELYGCMKVYKNKSHEKSLSVRNEGITIKGDIREKKLHQHK